MLQARGEGSRVAQHKGRTCRTSCFDQERLQHLHPISIISISIIIIIVIPTIISIIVMTVIMIRDKMLAYSTYRNQWTSSGDKKLVQDASKVIM